MLEAPSSVASENESARRIGDVQFMRQTVHRIEQDMSDECVCRDLQLFKLAQVLQVACLSLSKTDMLAHIARNKFFFQPFNLPKFYCNPLGGPSVYTSNVRYTYKTTLKLAKVSELEVGTF